jgi:hypothetical protein
MHHMNAEEISSVWQFEQTRKTDVSWTLYQDELPMHAQSCAGAIRDVLSVLSYVYDPVAFHFMATHVSLPWAARQAPECNGSRIRKFATMTNVSHSAPC